MRHSGEAFAVKKISQREGVVVLISILIPAFSGKLKVHASPLKITMSLY